MAVTLEQLDEMTIAEWMDLRMNDEHDKDWQETYNDVRGGM
jgi:hypothetical protein